MHVVSVDGRRLRLCSLELDRGLPSARGLYKTAQTSVILPRTQLPLPSGGAPLAPPTAEAHAQARRLDSRSQVNASAAQRSHYRYSIGMARTK
eukprot:6977242-Pyramimonas_sp.AAC.1